VKGVKERKGRKRRGGKRGEEDGCLSLQIPDIFDFSIVFRIW